LEEQGQTPEQRLLEVGWVKAPREVAWRLDVDDETRVVVRRRLSVVNGEPVAFCHSYYPPGVAEGTPLAERERIGIARSRCRTPWRPPTSIGSATR
jgi:GntR family transcriptional regulator